MVRRAGLVSWVAVSWLVALAGCAGDAPAASDAGPPPGTDAGLDAGVPAPTDSGARDAGASDAGGAVDAGTGMSVDAGGGTPDAGPIMPTSATPIDCGMACCNGAIPFGAGDCTNVALGATVTTSAVYGGGFPGEFASMNAVDGETICTSWNAGGYAPQWIAIDLGTPRTLAGLTLVAESVPETVHGVHLLEGSADGTMFTPIAVIDQDMTRAWHYEFHFTTPITTRHLRISTRSSPSWVAWREIAAFECP